MASSMHRLQISLPEWQLEYLRQRALREGVSIAEVLRRLVQREAEAVAEETVADSLWSIAGIGVDRETLVDDIPVSERPELYLTTGELDEQERHASVIGEKREGDKR